MVTARERRFIILMYKCGFWKTDNWLRITWIRPGRYSKFIFEWIRKRQKVDDLHHAPACPANHYHKQRLVFHPCTCGAV